MTGRATRKWLPREVFDKIVPSSFRPHVPARSPHSSKAFTRSWHSPIRWQLASPRGMRSLSSFGVDQAAMADLSQGAPPSLPTDTIVFVLATTQQVSVQRCVLAISQIVLLPTLQLFACIRASCIVMSRQLQGCNSRRKPVQGSDEHLVLLSTPCPNTGLYTITLPFAQLRTREDSGLAAARALRDAGVKCSNVLRNGAGVTLHPGSLNAKIVVESMAIGHLDGIDSAAMESAAVIMAPVRSLRASLMNLSREGRVVDENLFFFAAGMEAAAGNPLQQAYACGPRWPWSCVPRSMGRPLAPSDMSCAPDTRRLASLTRASTFAQDL